MNIKYFIPNLLTLCNLLCGLLSIFFLLKGLHLENFSKEYNYLSIGSYLIFIGGLFDLLDGDWLDLFEDKLLLVKLPPFMDTWAKTGIKKIQKDNKKDIK